MNPSLRDRLVRGALYISQVTSLSLALACTGSVSVAADKDPLKAGCSTTVAQCREQFESGGWQCGNVRVGKAMGNGLCQCECADPGGAIRVGKQTPR